MSLAAQVVVGFFRFWYDFLVGEAWEIAAGVAAALGLGVLLLQAEALPEVLLPYLLAAAMILVVTLSVLGEFRRKAREGG